ncbi:LacI family DNA-binding transcriptional regulator [Planctomonas psychrotolerans]|uniref:LacI family DNA-binding transcriptional regulator n=1 Tax=Planctomonas psychrotolerans TaxID=2528712 RepID=UPI001D0D6573|nr:LacI family DNA-binding transcriptional regulator [Planctomonas psychrotolerans]
MPTPDPPRRARPVTMSDVARHAGVSVMTVSNVINGQDTRVGEVTRQRVLGSIESLEYRVNVSARQLRRGRTGVVGLAVPNLALLYYGELADRLFRSFAQRGFRLVVEHTGGALEAELAALASSHLDAYDGLVLSVTRGEAADLESVGPTRPVVLIGERAVSRQYDHVLMDNVGGGHLATMHLLRSGSTRILLVGGQRGDHDSMPELRTRGYLAAHRELGVPVDERLIVATDFEPVEAYRAVLDAVDAGVPFDAVFALTDSSALGALHGLSSRGLRVPADVQVIGWDDVALGEFAQPSLSTVSPDNPAISDAIADLLTRRITAESPDFDAQIVMPKASLRLRDSTR